ncbi:hypothetical protein ASA1KI_35040 [Opitutales bacterium ASA1]|uniref:hypothetical protein n=1 Tax=Congregicoccus parvus TaxID=3081749 RepID=UPI002B2A19F8|nr:hypothetical protein ASA1KI_35040 [Opitutales bacterium ASA1]
MGGRVESLARWYSRAVGAMDATTGVLLMLAPAWTVSLFGAELPVGDDVSMRFVGAFVCGVGLVYLWAAVGGNTRGRECRLGTVWRVTAIVRAVVCAFVTWAVLEGRLGMAWSVVALSDGLLAALQMLFVRRVESS